MVLEIDEVRKQVEKIIWWHRIDLGNGIITPGKADTIEAVKVIGFPKNLTSVGEKGKSGR